MNKQYLQKLSKAENVRVAGAINSQKARDVSDVDFEPIFRNEVIYKALRKGRNPPVAGFTESMLPSISMFYDHILLQVCRTCACAKRPSLIEPYLEKSLVIPLLPGDYDDSPPDFVDTILRYSHMSSAEYQMCRTLSLFRQEDTYFCSHCVSSVESQCMSTQDLA
jgi:hypothetical protein